MGGLSPSAAKSRSSTSAALDSSCRSIHGALRPVKARKQMRGAGVYRRRVRRMSCTRNSCRSLKRRSFSAILGERSLCDTASGPHGAGCSSSSHRFVAGADAIKSSPKRSATAAPESGRSRDPSREVTRLHTRPALGDPNSGGVGEWRASAANAVAASAASPKLKEDARSFSSRWPRRSRTRHERPA